ncbi:hypothetical protein QAD02_003467 [Eretmocerus hayati]|uniref:Uncharacterized protein n=1 Tax=Eretmocerus hayati TaxID=131215 RepID=A0ACC2NMV7_9HYME|nr:hypothetical protein QAD02_003467 [Eretmocerus hayati]
MGYSLFNEVPDFHILKSAGDVMHDAFEGFVPTVMAKIVIELVNDGKLTIKHINNAIAELEFDFENSNKPPALKLDYLQSNKKLKMSSSESLFFVRYFGIMVGHRVDEDMPIWQLYIKLRDVIDILTSPEITEPESLQFNDDVEDFLEKWKEFDEDFTIKFHLLIHYLRELRANGPWIKYCMMGFESKHTEIKDIVSVVESNKNILKTIGIRLSLSLGQYQFKKYRSVSVKKGPSNSNGNVYKYFHGTYKVESLNHVTINDTCYKLGSIIVADIDGPQVEFGRITEIYRVDSTIHFEYEAYEYMTFDRRYYAYRVFQDPTSRELTSYNALACKTPCLLFTIEESLLITARHRL